MEEYYSESITMAPDYFDLSWFNETEMTLPELEYELPFFMRDPWLLKPLVITSFTLILFTVLVWIALWVKNRSRAQSTYRYLTVLAFLFATTLMYGLYFYGVVFSHRFYFGSDWIARFFLTLADHFSIFILLVSLVLRVVLVHTRSVAPEYIAISVVAAAVLALVLTIIVFVMEFKASFKVSLVGIFIFELLPNNLALWASILLNIYLLIRLFFVERPKSREVKVIRWSSVGLLVLTVYKSLGSMLHMIELMSIMGWTSTTSDLNYLNERHYSLFGFAIFLSLFLLEPDVLSLLPCIHLEGDDEYDDMDDNTNDTRPLKDAETAPATTTTEGHVKATVTSFEMDMTPPSRININLPSGKPAYGTIPERR